MEAASTAARDPAHRIVVISKFRYMGDGILAIPLLRALRRAFQASHITMVGSPAAGEAIRGCPYYDDYVPFHGYHGKRHNYFRYVELAWRMHSKKVETAILLNRSFGSAFLTFVAGVPRRIGFASEWRSNLLTHVIPYRWDAPEVNCYLSTLVPLGIEDGDTHLELWLSDKEVEEARGLMRKAGLRPDRPVAALQPATADPERRQWIPEGFAAVADHLHSRYGASLMILGGQEQRETATRMKEAMRFPISDMVGATSLRQTFALLACSSLFVSNDSGLVHAAVGLGTPTVTLMEPRAARKWGHPGPLHEVVVRALPEGVASITRRTLGDCLRCITVEEVTEACDRVLLQAEDVDPSQSAMSEE